MTQEYYYLKVGDVIQKGDSYTRDDGGHWYPVIVSGEVYQSHFISKYRRPIKSQPKQEHSPLPFRSFKDGLIRDAHGVTVVHQEGQCDAEDAAFIVKACNNHQSLVDALENAEKRLREEGHTFDADEARAALKQAKE